jgi:hypothetical protein
MEDKIPKPALHHLTDLKKETIVNTRDVKRVIRQPFVQK